jgi:diguanylate cyclase (GGDEF)-like protein
MLDQLVSNLMTRNVLCAEPETPLSELAAAMHERTYSCIVISQDDAPVGIVTERDVVGALDDVLNNNQTGNLPAAEFMSTPVLTIRDDAPVFEALVLCRSRHIRHLPVVDRHGRLAGLLTQSDLTRAHLRSIEEQRLTLEDPTSDADDLVAANERLKALAHEDALLEIGNRRAMEIDLQYTHEASLRYGTAYSVALCDVDYFKLYNDTKGHQAGDESLRRVVDFLKGEIRASDRIYRYGGDELLLLLPMTPMDSARTLCERLVSGIPRLRLTHRASPFGVFTLSCGVSSLQPNRRLLLSWRQVFDEADNALYRVKRGGRNGVAAFRGRAVRAGETVFSVEDEDYREATASS